MEKKKNAWNDFWQKAKPVFQKIGEVFRAIGRVLAVIWKYIVRLHAIFLAAPVVYAAMRIAMYAQEVLPETVGINLKENGEYALMVSRDVAIQGSLAVTAACLLMMFCSRRTIYPWLISIFSLILPVVIYLTNVFPA